MIHDIEVIKRSGLLVIWHYFMQFCVCVQLCMRTVLQCKCPPYLLDACNLHPMSGETGGRPRFLESYDF